MNAMTEPVRPSLSKEGRALETYDARDIVKNGVQACIVLDDQLYYLRITRAGKLILTK
ncbi:MAG: hemin uptake protein HemP [Pseudomonadota bacterium]